MNLNSSQKYNHLILFFALIMISIILRAYNYLPYETIAAEIATLLLCTLFYLNKLEYIRKYNKAEDEKLKKTLKLKIIKKENHIKFIFSIFAGIVLLGYYQMSSYKRMLVIEDEFLCKSRENFEVFVNKKDGWVLSDDYYFIKGQSQIKAFKCEKAEQ